jgi:hypothetical protein
MKGSKWFLVAALFAACVDDSASRTSTDPTCAAEPEPGTAKLDRETREYLASTPEPKPATVMVKGGAMPTPLPVCSGDCPEAELLMSRWTEENLAAQRCTRARIAELGGAAEPSAEWLVNVIFATLTVEQADALSTYPDVLSISARESAPLP